MIDIHGVLKVSSRRFRWSRGSNTFFADASDLDIKPGDQWPEEVDLISHRTGRKISFFFANVDGDRETGIGGVRYVAHERGDEGEMMEIFIFND